jgi:hypothetical protein
MFMYSKTSAKTLSWAFTSFKTPDLPMIPETEKPIGQTEMVPAGKTTNFKPLPS